MSNTTVPRSQVLKQNHCRRLHFILIFTRTSVLTRHVLYVAICLFRHYSLTTCLNATPHENLTTAHPAERVQHYNTCRALIAEHSKRRTLRSRERIATRLLHHTIVACWRGEFQYWAPLTPRTLRVILTTLLQYLRTRRASVTDLPAARAIL